MLRVLDLFSGIGGFSLGLERAGGFKTVAFCEIEPFPRRVLARHWPGVPIFEDVRTLSARHLTAAGIAVDVICGGFPCQDISVAGRGAGLAGERSGLWREFARLIGELRPGYVIVENVAALRSRGLGDVLGDLAALGYDAEWHCIPASAVGAPHRRDRVWIVGYPDRAGRQGLAMEHGSQRQETLETEWSGGTLADAASERRENRCSEPCGERQATRGLEPVGLGGADGAIPSGARLPLGPGTLGEWAHAATSGSGWWAAEPDVGRVVDGISDKMDRRKRLIGLGNAVVPQIPELIGRAIMARLPDIRSEDE